MSNRFKSLLNDTDTNSRVNINREPRYKTRENNGFVRRNKDEIIPKKTEVLVENNEANFPSLSENKRNEEQNITKTNYSVLLNNEDKQNKKDKRKGNKLGKGWVQLGNQNYQQEEEDVDYLFFIDCMVNLYECQISEKTEILGEEKYEAIYKFPNYDYDYFEKLDIIEEEELEREYENMISNDGSDISV